MTRIFVIAVLGGALLAGGCGTRSNLGPATEADKAAIVAAATATPRFQGGERIRITVFNEPTLTGDYDIDPSGTVSLPLAGTVTAVGLTQIELEQRLAEKFRTQYLRNPKVTVTILQFRPIYIVGEVEKQGEYAYKSGLNVLTAIALAGGATYRGSRDAVLIQHVGERGMKVYPMTSNILVLPGDLIRVPERYF
jgi:polysaccharide export outer membrane protein